LIIIFSLGINSLGAKMRANRELLGSQEKRGVALGAEGASLAQPTSRAVESSIRVFGVLQQPSEYLAKGSNRLKKSGKRVSTRVIWSQIKEVRRKLKRCVCNLHEAGSTCPFIKINTERLSKLQLKNSATS
jgi:hypothetical protein